MKKNAVRFLVFALISSPLFVSLGFADTISAVGGLSFGRNSGFNDVKPVAPTLGAEYTFSLGSHLQLGGFFDKQLLQFGDSSSGALNFVGVVLKYYFLDTQKSGPFVFGKGGLGSMTDNSVSSNQELCGGGGFGYRVVLSSHFSVGPQFGVSFLPDAPNSQSANEARYDGDIMFSLNF